MKNSLSRYLLCWLTLFGLSVPALSQTKLKLSEIEEQIIALEKTGGNDELAAVWKTAADYKKNLSDSVAKTKKQTAALRVYEKKKDQLDSLKFDLKIEKPTLELKLEEVAAKVDQLASEDENSNVELTALKQLEINRTARNGQIPNQIREIKSKLEKLQPLEPIDSDEPLLDKAKYQRDIAAKDYYQQFISELEVEQKVNEVGAPVLKVETRISEQKSVYYSEMLEIWKQRLSVLSAQDSATGKERIEQQIIDFKDIPDLEVIALENLGLLEDLEDLRSSSALDHARKTLAAMKSKQQLLETNRKYAVNRINQIEKAGLSVDKETGQLLRGEAYAIPKEKELSRKINSASEAYTYTQLRLLKLKNRRSALPENTEEFLSDLSKEGKLQGVSVDEARKVIAERENLLKDLIEAKTALQSTQKEQLEVLEKTVATTQSYSDFINERLIWIASTDVLGVQDLRITGQGVASLFSGESLAKWFYQLQVDVVEHYIVWSIALLVLGFLLWKFKHYKSLACGHHKKARRRNCQSFKPTLKGATLEMLTVLPLPLVFGFLAWRSTGIAVYEKSLFVAAIFSFLAGLAWVYSRSDGLIVSNFNLNARQCKIIHRTMGWFLPFMLPLLMLFIAMSQMLPYKPPIDSSTSIPLPYGRIFFIITLVVTLGAFVQLFRPKHQLLNNSNAECSVAKTIFVICMIIPTVLIVGAWLGYYESALLLRNQFIGSVWVIVISMFIAALLSRWFLVSSRKLAIKQALKRREALIQEREKEKEGAEDTDSKVVTRSAEEVEAEAVNVAGVKEQTTKLVRVALICSIVFSLWGIWSSSLTALSILDKQKLWEHSARASASESQVSNPLTQIISGSKDSAKAELAKEEEELDEKHDWVSLQDLLFSMIIFLLTYIAAKNIPGLLEITILDNLNFNSGAAFALTTTVRYLIVLFGVIWAFGNIGVTWGSIQWIAAAVTLGIGFGLQEVFANFVAGLILLYERPIRLGDVVTVGDVSGRVTKIKIRATTVHQFNNHELIVPNKEFITGQLINWTLSDNIIRTEVIVGIAYGSDTRLAERVLRKVAADHPKVLKTPKPDVQFTAFGASSLDFKLRCFVAGYDDLVPTNSDLHYQVNEAFAEAGLEIAFPQQDLHIKSVDKPIPLELAKMLADGEES